VLVALGAVGTLALSGGSSSDPSTPAALPGLPPPFQTVAVVGRGGLTAGVDAYGDIVDLRIGPAGTGLIDNPHSRQSAGTVPADTGIVPRVSVDGGPAQPLWRADSIDQRFLPHAAVLRTSASFGETGVDVECAAGAEELGCITGYGGERPVEVSFDRDLLGGGMRVHLDDDAARRLVGTEIASGRQWVGKARPLGAGAPGWAWGMYEHSLLVLRALTDRRTGAVAAGARDGWAYVWPRDAAAVAIALASSGYRVEARRVARFLLDLDLNAGARFDGDGAPAPGRAAQGDAAGWVAAAADAVGLRPPTRPYRWRGRADYQEGEPDDYLGNAIADGTESGDIGRFQSRRRDGGLVREAGDPRSGLDSAAAWAVRPFPEPARFPAVRDTLLRLVARGGRFGIVPSENWGGGDDPWTAPTAWTAYSLAMLARIGGQAPGAERDRAAALRLMADLRRAATPAGVLPERVDARTGVPSSTAPLAWSHAFAILAVRQLWP
jgi:hypothetical protein